MRFIKFVLLLAHRRVLLIGQALRIFIFLKKVDVPLTSNISVSEQERLEFTAIIYGGVNQTAVTPLTPMTN